MFLDQFLVSYRAKTHTHTEQNYKIVKLQWIKIKGQLDC